MQSSDNVLRQGGYRLTPQRYMILRVIEEAQEHLNIEQIAHLVQERNPRVSLGTIYRTLQLLQELGLVRETHFPGKPPCYEVGNGKAHHHFICRKCHSVIHLDHALLDQLHEQLQTQYHVFDLTLELLVTGHCDPCWQTMQQENSMCLKDEVQGETATQSLPADLPIV